MSDQNVITDWLAHFRRLDEARGHPLVSTIADFSDPYPGEAKAFVVFMKDPKTGDLGYVDLRDEANPFEAAKDVYEANEGPEMWLFWSTGGQPWHCPARPRVKARRK